jgi:hypothetical protein
MPPTQRPVAFDVELSFSDQDFQSLVSWPDFPKNIRSFQRPGNNIS